VAEVVRCPLLLSSYKRLHFGRRVVIVVFVVVYLRVIVLGLHHGECGVLKKNLKDNEVNVSAAEEEKAEVFADEMYSILAAARPTLGVPTMLV
jgi:hypothetical protein